MEDVKTIQSPDSYVTHVTIRENVTFFGSLIFLCSSGTALNRTGSTGAARSVIFLSCCRRQWYHYGCLPPPPPFDLPTLSTLC